MSGVRFEVLSVRGQVSGVTCHIFCYLSLFFLDNKGYIAKENHITPSLLGWGLLLLLHVKLKKFKNLTKWWS